MINFVCRHIWLIFSTTVQHFCTTSVSGCKSELQSCKWKQPSALTSLLVFTPFNHQREVETCIDRRGWCHGCKQPNGQISLFIPPMTYTPKVTRWEPSLTPGPYQFLWSLEELLGTGETWSTPQVTGALLSCQWQHCRDQHRSIATTGVRVCALTNEKFTHWINQSGMCCRRGALWWGHLSPDGRVRKPNILINNPDRCPPPQMPEKLDGPVEDDHSRARIKFPTRGPR